jgi:hypothetical protein
MQVEIDIFSGRPNPHWNLTPSEINDFSGFLKVLPKITEKASVQDGLGYRGLILTELSKNNQNYSMFSISNGLVEVRKHGYTERFLDKGRKLERWVFKTGKGRMDNFLYQQIDESIHL